LSNVELARSAIRRAGRWLQSAKRALEDGRWDDVVYSSQMTTESSAKAVLIALGVDYPKEHDVSTIFEELSRRTDLPSDFKESIRESADTIAELAELRGLAGYGFETGIDAEYFKEYAPEAISRAEKLYNRCLTLLRSVFPRAQI